MLQINNSNPTIWYNYSTERQLTYFERDQKRNDDDDDDDDISNNNSLLEFVRYIVIPSLIVGLVLTVVVYLRQNKKMKLKNVSKIKNSSRNTNND